jgi:hypothetical protein
LIVVCCSALSSTIFVDSNLEKLDKVLGSELETNPELAQIMYGRAIAGQISFFSLE